MKFGDFWAKHCNKTRKERRRIIKRMGDENKKALQQNYYDGGWQEWLTATKDQFDEDGRYGKQYEKFDS